MAKAIDMEEARAKLKTVSNVAGERQADERELKEYRVALKAAGLDSISDDDSWIIRGTSSALDMTPMISCLRFLLDARPPAPRAERLASRYRSKFATAVSS